MIIAAVTRTKTVTHRRRYRYSTASRSSRWTSFSGVNCGVAGTAPGAADTGPAFAGFGAPEIVGSAIGRYWFGLIGAVGTIAVMPVAAASNATPAAACVVVVPINPAN